MPDWPDILAAMREDGITIADHPPARRVGGGSISTAWRIEANGTALFVKSGNIESLDMFEAEADGLRELGAANEVRVPQVVSCGATARAAYLALEWIDFDRRTGETAVLLGRQLAAMHRHCSEKFGWHRNNTIGRTPQDNRWADDWVEFFRSKRLDFQLQLARRKGFDGELQSAGAALSENLPELFRNYRAAPSLLHGDLWGGNWGATKGQPVIFDPAVYYGDRESDIAMTKLFGGFEPAFYSAYQESWPMEDGYQSRQKLYQLYHVLNHLNLFGSAYLGGAMQLILELQVLTSR
jgi:protein-ribulosamine 3-kinase